MAANGNAVEPALDPSAAEFVAFDRFPWSKHRAFLAGLVETLGGVDALVPSPTHEGSSAFCRTVFFRMQTGRRVDLTRYNQFRAAHPAYPSVDQRLLATLYAAAAAAAAEVATTTEAETEGGDEPPVPELSPTDATDKAERSRRVVEAVARGPVVDAFDGAAPVSAAPPPAGDAGDDSSIPSWMRRAPTAALHVERASLRGGGGGGEPPHSDKFAKIVEAIETGKPVEGIQQIPDTVVRRAGITPVGKLKARPKPWETAAAAAAAAGTDGDAAAKAAAPAGGLTSIMSVLSLGAEGKEEDGPDGRQQQQQQTTVLEFPPLPESSPAEAEPETGAATTEIAATTTD